MEVRRAVARQGAAISRRLDRARISPRARSAPPSASRRPSSPAPSAGWRRLRIQGARRRRRRAVGARALAGPDPRRARRAVPPGLRREARRERELDLPVGDGTRPAARLEPRARWTRRAAASAAPAVRARRSRPTGAAAGLKRLVGVGSRGPAPSSRRRIASARGHVVRQRLPAPRPLQGAQRLREHGDGVRASRPRSWRPTDRR